MVSRSDVMSILLSVFNKLPHLVRKPVIIATMLGTRAMTLGVKAVIADEEGRVLLLRHTYLEGWHCPGGGVERGETVWQAVEKEVREETARQIIGRPRLHQIYRNANTSRFDHVVVFVCETEPMEREFVPDYEIAEIGFFALDDLPVGTTRQTRELLAEVFDENSPRDNW